ncbi:MAG TPA: hypothetical protein VIG33_01405 [Pseudobdellovibrionaceae bacterium]|jgi:hypothetical protein
MNNFLRSSLLSALLLTTACGGSSDNKSFEDISELRARAKKEMTTGPQPPPERVVYVTKEKEVIKEQATLTDSYFKIDLSEKMMSFYEGQPSAYKITLRVQDPQLQMKLTAKGLPSGAELKDISTAKNPNTYELRWTPPLYTISYDQQPPQIMTATLVPVLVSAKTSKKAETVKGLSLDRTITFNVFRNQDKPSELVLSGLDQDVQEGQVVPFSVIARFPGVDTNAPIKPDLGFFRDKNTQVVASNYLEMDGTRYVSIENVEYIGDYKWKFNLVFDTKNNPVETQKSKDGSAAAVNFTQVRLGLRVFGAFNASPATVVRVKIIRAATEATPVAPAPAPAPAPPKDPAPSKPTPKKAPKPKSPTKPKSGGK